MRFGARLKELREENSLTQAELGEKLNLRKANISKYENEKLQPNLETLNFLASFFKVSVDYILGNSDIREIANASKNEISHLQQTVDTNEVITKSIEDAIKDDPDLLEFFLELKQRNDLKLLLKEVKTLSQPTIKRIIRYIKMVEDEEATNE